MRAQVPEIKTPLVVTAREVDKALAIFAEVLADVQKQSKSI